MRETTNHIAAGQGRSPHDLEAAARAWGWTSAALAVLAILALFLGSNT